MKHRYKILLQLIVFGCVPFMATAQTITLTGQKTLGGSSEDIITASAITSGGDYLFFGESNSDNDGDKAETNRGDFDYWLLKLDPQFNVLWQKTLGGVEIDRGTTILETDDDEILVGGSSKSGITGDKTVDSIGGWDFWVIKLDADGNEVWQKTYGGNGDDLLSKVVKLANGNLLFAGSSTSGVFGDKTSPSRGSFDYWLVRTDANGNVLADYTYGGDEFDIAESVSILPNGGILLSGMSVSDMSGDKSEDNYGVSNVWLLRLDATGNILWDKTLGGSAAESDGLSTYSNGGIYVVANSSSPVSGTKTQPSRGLVDMWLTKLDLDGNIIWDKAYGGSSGDGPLGITETGTNELMLTGFSLSNTSGEKTEDSNGMADMWLVAIDTNGTVLWDKGIGGSLEDYAVQTVAVDEGHYVVAGYSESGISGDKTESNRGENDYWLVEIATSVNITESEVLELTMYPNPVNEQLQINWEKATPNCQGVIEIHHSDGSLVQRVGADRTLTTIPTGHLSEGLYTVSLTDCNGNRATEQMVRLRR